MNEELARLYGTNANSESAGYDVDALEKMAQFALLTKEAAAEGIDLTQLTPEEQEYVLFEMAKSAQYNEPSQDMLDKEAQAKLEEADYIGRVIAHAFWQEKTAIEKEAALPTWTAEELAAQGRNLIRGGKKAVKPERKFKATVSAPQPKMPAGSGLERSKKDLGGFKGEAAARKKEEAGKGALRRAYEATLGRVGGAASGATGRALEREKGGPMADIVHRLGGAKPGEGTFETYQKGRERLSRGVGRAAEVGTAVGATGLAVGGGLAANEALKDKKGSALDTLVDQRAYEILAANGLVYEDGSVVPPYVEKQAEASEFDSFVDQTALNYLAELGYQVG